MPICGDCAHYRQHNDNGHGECKAHSPVCESRGRKDWGDVTAVWPVVEGDSEACGEFKRLPVGGG